MNNPREACVFALLSMQKGGYSNLVVKQLLSNSNLSKQDQGFFTKLFYGTLERKITIDFVLETLTEKRFKKLDSEILAILEIGCYQIFYMQQVPNFAAVSESVKLCRKFKKTSASSFVNAILRKVASFDLNSLDKTETIQQKVVKYSVNEQLLKRIEQDYKQDSEKILNGFFEQKDVYIRVNTLRHTAKQAAELLKSEGIETKSTELPDCLKVVSGNVVGSNAFASGDVRIQSLSAQAAVAALEPKRLQTIIDMCAAPGGKTLTAAMYMQNEGTVLACDRSKSRLALVEQTAEKEGITTVQTIVCDSSAFNPEFENSAHGVICDVPCSGFGELGSKPELRLKYPEPDDSELFMIQKAIAENAFRYVKVGGRVVYSTCTIDRRENEDIVRHLVEKFRSFAIVNPIQKHFKNFVTEQNCIKFLPHDGFCEGFFVATFERLC